MTDWLHDENGNIRKALRSVSASEIEGLAAGVDARVPPLSAPCTFDVRQGDELQLGAQFRSAWDAEWVTVVRVDRNPVMGVGFLCRAADGSGGFTRPDMFIGWRRPAASEPNGKAEGGVHRGGGGTTGVGERKRGPEVIPIDEMTAKWIRVLRVDLRCSWGRIGELYKAVTGDTFDGGIQQSGARLCEWSASLLGEKCGEEPWN